MHRQDLANISFIQVCIKNIQISINRSFFLFCDNQNVPFKSLTFCFDLWNYEVHITLAVLSNSASFSYADNGAPNNRKTNNHNSSPGKLCNRECYGPRRNIGCHAVADNDVTERGQCSSSNTLRGLVPEHQYCVLATFDIIVDKHHESNLLNKALPRSLYLAFYVT